jgi:hypothetical protein
MHEGRRRGPGLANRSPSIHCIAKILQMCSSCSIFMPREPVSKKRCANSPVLGFGVTFGTWWQRDLQFSKLTVHIHTTGRGGSKDALRVMHSRSRAPVCDVCTDEPGPEAKHREGSKHALAGFLGVVAAVLSVVSLAGGGARERCASACPSTPPNRHPLTL